jgi:branched-chain amino acid transport system permease protein
MITLAIAQMVVFLLPASAIHSRRGWHQAVPRGKLFGVLDLANTLTMYYVVLVIFLGASCSSIASSIHLSARY